MEVQYASQKQAAMLEAGGLGCPRAKVPPSFEILALTPAPYGTDMETEA